MQIQLKENLYNDVKTASRFIGVDEEELIDRALLFYLNSIQAKMDLEKELKAWDYLSDEALMSMDAGLK
ncbi:MAG: hypothetical protein ABH896_02265 [Candidatus Jacksonbacteria bacterium]